MKDVTALNKCSACGHVKKAHFLCPYCVRGKLMVERSIFKYLQTAEIQKGVFSRNLNKSKSDTPTDKQYRELGDEESLPGLWHSIWRFGSEKKLYTRFPCDVKNVQITGPRVR